MPAATKATTNCARILPGTNSTAQPNPQTMPLTIEPRVNNHAQFSTGSAWSRRR
jgi:hypothetical protein